MMRAVFRGAPATAATGAEGARGVPAYPGLAGLLRGATPARAPGRLAAAYAFHGRAVVSHCHLMPP
jgi:hypothetical protein